MRVAMLLALEPVATLPMIAPLVYCRPGSFWGGNLFKVGGDWVLEAVKNGQKRG
jgi:hypothetical protein